MKNRTITILVGIFIILCLLIVGQSYLPSFKKTDSTKFSAQLTSLSVQNVKSIEVTKGTNSLKIDKKDNEWGINGKKADKEKIKSFLDKLVGSPTAEIIAQTNTRHTSLQVTQALGTTVKLNNDITLIFGSSSIDGTYMRFSGSDIVYLIKDINSSVSTDESDWVSKESTPSSVLK